MMSTPSYWAARLQALRLSETKLAAQLVSGGLVLAFQLTREDVVPRKRHAIFVA